MLLSLFRLIQKFRSSRRTYTELSALSDRELSDIGIARWDIQRVADGTYTPPIEMAR
jgi:uncharacterized protein YjiS (DUF1127 family)